MVVMHRWDDEKRRRAQYAEQEHEASRTIVAVIIVIALLAWLLSITGCTTMTLPDGRIFRSDGIGSNMTYEKKMKVEYYPDGSTSMYELVEHVSREETASKVIHAGEGLVGTLVDGYSKMKP
jgi:hypothetical protein